MIYSKICITEGHMSHKCLSQNCMWIKVTVTSRGLHHDQTLQQGTCVCYA